jgi:hypothetical protein
MRPLGLSLLGLLLVVAGCAAAPDESPSQNASAVSDGDVTKLAAQWGLGKMDGRPTTDRQGNTVYHFGNPQNPNTVSSYVVTDHDDGKVVMVTVSDPAGDDFVIDGVFLQAAYMFDLHGITPPVRENDQLIWGFGQGGVTLRDPLAACHDASCTAQAKKDLSAATTSPSPHKLGSSEGYVTSLVVGDGIDPAWEIDEASVWLAYRYRTKLGHFKFGPSDEGKLVFDGGEIKIEDEGNVVTYTVSLRGIGEMERCMTSAVQPDYVCHTLP